MIEFFKSIKKFRSNLNFVLFGKVQETNPSKILKYFLSAQKNAHRKKHSKSAKKGLKGLFDKSKKAVSLF